MGDDATTASSTTTTPVPEKKTSSSIFLQIKEHQDGSITRPTVPNLPSTDPDSNPSSPVFSKDLPLNPSLNTSLRLYLPNPSLTTNNRADCKLPLVVYYHGGGFVLFSPAFILYHQFCHQMAASLPALVVSLDYRLAPEHRLPAAYEDAVEALLWARASSDPWIVRHADPSRCFVIGSSSGGNMAYHAGLRAADMELSPLKIRGLVLIQPYFGGEARTGSEVESEEDEILPLRANEMMWRMALPVGATRDHEFCSPRPPTNGYLPVKTMVMGCRGDPLFERQKMFVKMLRGAGAGEMLVDRLEEEEEEEEGYHAIELFDPARADAVLAQIRGFVDQDAAVA